MPAKQKKEIKVSCRKTVETKINFFHSYFFWYVQIHYDSTFNADTSDVNTYLDQMVTHVQAHFCQISLGTQIAVEVCISKFNFCTHAIFTHIFDEYIRNKRIYA